jgi:hypothetical protein
VPVGEGKQGRGDSRDHAFVGPGQAVVAALTGAGLSSDERACRTRCALGPKVVQDPAQVKARSFLANAASSDEEFDRWFMGSVAEVHGMDTSGPMPPMATRKL